MSTADLPGAFVVSLDFELAWGFEGRKGDVARRASVLGARSVVPRLLALFEEFEVAATWAVVGFLFAESRGELERWSPEQRPEYADPALGNYGRKIGADERDDPLHFASSLIRIIQSSPRQEIATHTFSHYYCLEPGQSRETFGADLRAACAIARRDGVDLRSIVFPRNQHNSNYDDILLAHGITGYRGNPRTWAWSFSDSRQSRNRVRRALRLIDSYIPLLKPGTLGWGDVLQPSGLADVRATVSLASYRPALKYLEALRLRRVLGGIRRAARNREIFHLWWHPHNFGAQPERSLRFLRGILEEVARCRGEHGLRSLSMADVQRLARAGATRPSAHVVG